MKFDNKNLMDDALIEAQKAYDKGEIPVGCVIFDNISRTIVSQTHNMVEQLQDATAHAEMIAIKEACAKLGSKFLENCDIYVTLEPCPMCAQAISFVRIKRLYFAASNYKGGGIDNGPCIFSQSTCFHKPEIYSDIRVQKSAKLLKNFFNDKKNCDN